MAEIFKDKYIGQLDADITKIKAQIKDLNENLLMLQRMKNIAQGGIPDAPERDVTFGSFLSRLCTEESLTSQELGDLIGFSGPAITNWKGGMIPCEKNRGRIANALHDIAPRYRSEDIIKLMMV